MGPQQSRLSTNVKIKRDGLKKKMGGITDPYLYIGGLKTTFGWHVEDLNMASINYLHFGKPKFWYCISKKDFKKFEHFVKSLFPFEFLNCSQFLRHKVVIVDPYFVREYLPEIQIFKILQKEGEFVITMNSSYHCGFNFGFNIAESVNFATPCWLPEFPKFKICMCQNGNFFINPENFKKNLENCNLISGVL